MVFESNDGSILVSGDSYSNDDDATGNQGYGDLLLAKLDASGNLINSKLYGGSESECVNLLDNEKPTGVIKQTSDGGFVLLGSTKSNDGGVSGNNGDFDFWLIKIDSLWNIEWQSCIGGGGTDYAKALGLTSDGGYILAGQYNNENAWIVNMKGNNTSIAKQDQNAKVSIFPNPTSDVLKIVIDWDKPQESILTIYDITGRICLLQNLEKSEHIQKQIDVSKMPVGSYYLKVENARGQMSKAFQVVK